MEKVNQEIKLRPHHLMCIHGFQGHGYSPHYVKNFWNIVKELNTDLNTEIKVTTLDDDICRACPNLTATTEIGEEKSAKKKICAPHGKSEEMKIKKLDDAYLKALGISDGQNISMNNLIKLIRLNVNEEVFEHACAPCSWKNLGYCKTALYNIRSSK